MLEQAIDQEALVYNAHAQSICPYKLYQDTWTRNMVQARWRTRLFFLDFWVSVCVRVLGRGDCHCPAKAQCPDLTINT